MPGSNIDTQTTAPWVGQGSQDSSELPLATIANLQELPPAELGPVMFDGQARLSPGAEGLKDYFLSEFPDCMMKHDLELDSAKYTALPRVLAITKDLIKELCQAMDKRAEHEKTFGPRRAAAEEAAARVCSQADQMGVRSEKGQRKKAMTVAWLTREIAKLEATGRNLRADVARLSLVTGKKVYALWKHLQTHNLLSQQFLDRVEAWHELDVVSSTSEILQRAFQTDAYAETQLEDDGDHPQLGGLVLDAEQATQPAVELEEQAKPSQPSQPIPNPGPEQTSTVEDTVSSPMRNPVAEQPQQAAVEATVSPLESLANPGAEQVQQAAAEATVSFLAPLANPGAEQPQQAAVEATVSPLGPLASPGSEQPQQAAVEATVSPLGNPGAEQAQQAAAEPTVSCLRPLANPGAEQVGNLADPAIQPAGAQQAEETSEVEATVSPLGIGNPSAEQAQQSAVESTVSPLGIGNPGAEQNTQADATSPRTPIKVHVQEPELRIRTMATPQRHPQSPRVPVIACDSDAEDDAVADALLTAQFQASHVESCT